MLHFLKMFSSERSAKKKVGGIDFSLHNKKNIVNDQSVQSVGYRSSLFSPFLSTLNKQNIYVK